MKPVDISKQAERDFVSIAGYLAEFSPSAAEQFIVDVLESFLRLREFPELGLPHTSPRGRAQRRLHFGDLYHVTYEVMAAKVLVKRIKDGRRKNA